VAAALLACWLGKPFVVTARGTDLNLIPQHRLPRKMIHWAAARADASIGVCAALMDVLRDWGLDGSRLHVIRNGVDLERFKPWPQEAMRAQLGLAGAPLLLSVGHLIERKGHHLAIEALAQLLPAHPQARLLIVGEGAERGSLEQLIRRLGVQDHARLVGAVPNDQLAQWYSAADALILASSREGWANVLLESMACGTPVVATRIWGTPEVVANATAGQLVDERSGAGIAAGVAALLRSPPDRAAVRAYAEGFSWQGTSDRQLELLSSLARPALEARHA
jgi:glycosyltransferase involved in cell wall biosynthesis